MRSAVLLLIFKRPWCVKQAMAALRLAAPPRLYIAADGPRDDRPEEKELCRQARAEALNVDWPCEIKTLFREHNMGGPLGIPDAINWFFTQEPEGIILEDDTIPVQEFFSFCDTLLERYRDEPQVMHITGNNFHCGLRYGKASYFFSSMSHNWGWATWRRAWRHYEEWKTLPRLDDFIKDDLPCLLAPSALPYWISVLTDSRERAASNWDARWQYTVWQGKGLCATPQINMVRNIGSGPDSGHFPHPFIWMFLKTRGELSIRHPEVVLWKREADIMDTYLLFGPACITAEACLRETLIRLRRGQYRGAAGMLGLARRFYGIAALLNALKTIGKERLP